MKRCLIGLLCAALCLAGGCMKGDLPDSRDELPVESDPAWDTAAPAAEKTVYLTFDDGPCKSTGVILDILKEENVPAAFFVIASEKDYAGEMYARIADEGHVLANHTCSHVYKQIYSSFEALKQELEDLEEFVMEKSGCEVQKIFRFPGGSTNGKKYLGANIKEKLSEWGYRVFDWNCSGEDAVRGDVSAEEIYKNTVSSAEGKNTVVVLLHSAAYAKGTVEALPKIIQYFKEQGYRFASFSDEAAPENWWFGDSH